MEKENELVEEPEELKKEEEREDMVARFAKKACRAKTTSSKKKSSDLPKMKVWEEGNDVIVRVSIVGVDEKDIELEVREDYLKIKISHEFENSVKEGKCIGEEWENSSFDGVVSLPCKVVPMLVHHSYDGEFLEVRLKKIEKN